MKAQRVSTNWYSSAGNVVVFLFLLFTLACSEKPPQTTPFKSSTHPETILNYHDSILQQVLVDYQATKALLDTLKMLEQQSGPLPLINQVKINLAQICRKTSNYTIGLDYLYEVIQSKQLKSNPTKLGWVYNEMADIYYEMALHQGYTAYLFDSSSRYAVMSIALSREVNDLELESNSLNINGMVNFCQENYSQAQEDLERSLLLNRKSGKAVNLAVLSNLAHLYHKEGHTQEALELARECYTLASEQNKLTFLLMSLQRMIAIYQETGDTAMVRQLTGKITPLTADNIYLLKSLLVKEMLLNYDNTRAIHIISGLSKEISMKRATPTINEYI